MPEKLHCIRYRRATDTARVSGLDVMYSLNLLTMGVAEPVAECQPRICDGRKPDIEKQNWTFKWKTGHWNHAGAGLISNNLIGDRPR